MDTEMRGFVNHVLESLGRLEQGQESLNQHIIAVSENVKDVDIKLDAHKGDDRAHGLGAMRWVFGAIVGLMGAAIPAWEFLKARR